MLVQLRMGKAAALKEYLATEHGILIRDASNFEGLNEHFSVLLHKLRKKMTNW